MQVVLRAAALYAFVWLVTRAMGRKELSELSSFELILMVAIGDLIQQGVTGDDRSVTGAMLAVATFALLTIGLSYVTFRWRRMSPLVEGIPVVILRDGRILHEVLRIERLTLDEVSDAAREQGIADLREVAIGVLEADGKFSFIRGGGPRDQTARNQERKA
jgi:uncharacterized membrane protein YcaP (DUF421 family)